MADCKNNISIDNDNCSASSGLPVGTDNGLALSCNASALDKLMNSTGDDVVFNRVGMPLLTMNQLAARKVYFEDFGAKGDGVDDTEAVRAAMQLVKDGCISEIYGTSCSTYAINTEQDELFYLNFVKGNGCKITVRGGGQLTYLGGRNDLLLNDLTFNRVGQKKTPDTVSSGGIALYDINDSLTEINSSNVSDVYFYALTDEIDPDSWSDDVNKSRLKSALRVKAKNSKLSDCNFYGFGLCYSIAPTSDLKANHYEHNVHAFNCETVIFTVDPSGDGSIFFQTGESKNCTLNNNATQKTYWIGQNQGTGTNGKDVILDEANHVARRIIDGINSENAIERPVYGQSNNVTLTNCTSDGSAFGGPMLKYEVDDVNQFRRGSTMDGINNIGANDAAIDIQVYGQRDLLITNFDYNRIQSNTFRRSVDLSRRARDCKMIRGSVSNAAMFVYATEFQDTTPAGMTASHQGWLFSDVDLYNVYSRESNLAYVLDFKHKAVDYSITTLEDTVFDNIRHQIDYADGNGDPVDINRHAFNFVKMKNTRVKNCNLSFRWSPWTVDESTDIYVDNCVFTQYINSTAAGAIQRLKDQNLQSWKANTFDFKIRSGLLLPSGGTETTAFEIDFYKGIDEGLVNCIDYWTRYSQITNIPGSSALFERYELTNKDSIVTVRLGTSAIKLAYKSSNNTMREISKQGDLFSSDVADFSSNYVVYAGVEGGADNIIIRSNSVGLPGGALIVTLEDEPDLNETAGSNFGSAVFKLTSDQSATANSDTQLSGFQLQNQYAESPGGLFGGEIGTPNSFGVDPSIWSRFKVRAEIYFTSRTNMTRTAWIVENSGVIQQTDKTLYSGTSQGEQVITIETPIYKSDAKLNVFVKPFAVNDNVLDKSTFTIEAYK